MNTLVVLLRDRRVTLLNHFGETTEKPAPSCAQTPCDVCQNEDEIRNRLEEICERRSKAGSFANVHSAEAEGEEDEEEGEQNENEHFPGFMSAGSLVKSSIFAPRSSAFKDKADPMKRLKALEQEEQKASEEENRKLGSMNSTQRVRYAMKEKRAEPATSVASSSRPLKEQKAENTENSPANIDDLSLKLDGSTAENKLRDQCTKALRDALLSNYRKFSLEDQRFRFRHTQVESLASYIERKVRNAATKALESAHDTDIDGVTLKYKKDVKKRCTLIDRMTVQGKLVREKREGT